MIISDWEIKLPIIDCLKMPYLKTIEDVKWIHIA